MIVLCEYTKNYLTIQFNKLILYVNYISKTFCFKRLYTWRNKGAWLIYLHLPLALPYRTIELEGCLESLTSTLLGLYPGKRKLREN